MSSIIPLCYQPTLNDPHTPSTTLTFNRTRTTKGTKKTSSISVIHYQGRMGESTTFNHFFFGNSSRLAKKEHWNNARKILVRLAGYFSKYRAVLQESLPIQR